MMFGIYFLVMGLLVLILSGLIACCFPRLKSVYIISFSIMFGMILTATFELPKLLIFSAVFSGILSFLAVGFVKLIFSIKQKGDISKNN